MVVELFSESLRPALGGVAGGAALVAGILAWRRAPAGWVAAATGVALAALILVGLEPVVAWLVGVSAPDASDFNEYRWVLLAPWGRAGLAVGLVCVAGILALS